MIEKGLCESGLLLGRVSKLGPKVSVIIPTKNRAHYVSSAIRSVLNQTFRDFEIIAVDGASSDNTKEVIKGFTDQRINYIRQENDKGVSAARNLGIIHSRGEIIAFLDDDDLWMPGMLEKQLGFMNRRPGIGAVYTSHFGIDEGGKRFQLRLVDRSMRGDIFPKILERNYIGNCSGIMVRKTCFCTTGLFDENLLAAEDWDMWIRLAKHYEFDFTDEPLYLYRVHEKRLSARPFVRLRAESLLFEKLQPEFKKLEDTRAVAYWHYRIGKLYCRCGNMKKGREEFKMAVDINPHFVMCHLLLFASLLGTKMYRITRKLVKDALPFSIDQVGTHRKVQTWDDEE